MGHTFARNPREKDVGFMEKAVRQCRNPQGFFAGFVGRSMNRGHRKLRHWGLSHISIASNWCILDVGCGGGKAVQELARISSSGKIYGIDYSEAMVKLARKINKKFVENGHIEITKGFVSSLPYPDCVFDFVTAFESYYFWPDLINDLKEIMRVMKPGGSLLMANEAYTQEKFEKRNSRWAKCTGMMLHTPEGYRGFFTEAGYTKVEIDVVPEKNWIAAVAEKER